MALKQIITNMSKNVRDGDDGDDVRGQPSQRRAPLRCAFARPYAADVARDCAYRNVPKLSPLDESLVQCAREAPHSRRVRASVPLVARPWLRAANT